MARRRKKTSHRKRSRRKGMSEGKSFMSAPGRRSRRRKSGRRRRSGMSEAFTGNNLHKSAKETVAGLMGGAIAVLINKFPMPPLLRGAVNIGASFVTSSLMDAPNMGAGIAGAYGMLLTQQLTGGGLQENYPYANPDVLQNNYPQFADAGGNPMYLANDGNLYYLDENVDPQAELREPMYLADNIYPNYTNPADY